MRRSREVSEINDVYREANRRFFENAPADWLENLADVKGLDENIDLQVIEPYIKDRLSTNSHACLEIGFGYGRVIRWLFDNNPLKRILAIDHSARCVSEIAEKAVFFGRPLFPLKGCISNTTISEPIDLALWMWAGIFELSETHKQSAIKNISNGLVKGGLLAIEFPDEIIGHESVEYHADGLLKVNTDFGQLNVFRSSAKMLCGYAQSNSLEVLENISYLTKANIKRRILLFKKI